MLSTLLAIVAAGVVLLALPWVPQIAHTWDWSRLQPHRGVEQGETALRGTTTVAGLVNLVQDSVTVDGKISGRSLANLLNLMDTTFKVSDALGTGNSLSELISDLRNDVVDLDTMVHLASRAVFSDDGELRVSVALPKTLPLLSADDTVIHSLDFKALLTASQPVI